MSERSADRRTGEPAVSGRFAGLWYLVLPVVTLGLLASAPFWHAASRLRAGRPAEAARAANLAWVFTAVLALQLAFSSVRMTTTLGGLFGVGAMIAAPLLARPYRSLVYGRGTATLGYPVADPLVSAQLARNRRAEARRLAEQDPALAVELGIGRPDSPTGYDDGGLLDLNRADARQLGQVMDLSPETAARIIVERERNGGSFSLIEEAVTFAELTEGEALRVRDHGVLLPR